MVRRSARASALLSIRGARRRTRFTRSPRSSLTRRHAIVRFRRGVPVQGGFFGSIVKGVKKVVGTVARIPVVGAVAKTVLTSVPVLGGVVTAVGAVKSAIRPPTVANTGNTTATTGAPPLGQPQAASRPPARRTRKPRARRVSRGTRRRPAKRARGISAKQRAARARFARAARKGRIRKGARL